MEWEELDLQALLLTAVDASLFSTIPLSQYYSSSVIVNASFQHSMKTICPSHNSGLIQHHFKMSHLQQRVKQSFRMDVDS